MFQPLVRIARENEKKSPERRFAGASRQKRQAEKRRAGARVRPVEIGVMRF
jgi:hypothetical protein